jgi:hypothetical protein
MNGVSFKRVYQILMHLFYLKKNCINQWINIFLIKNHVFKG